MTAILCRKKRHLIPLKSCDQQSEKLTLVSVPRWVRVASRRRALRPGFCKNSFQTSAHIGVLLSDKVAILPVDLNAIAFIQIS